MKKAEVNVKLISEKASDEADQNQRYFTVQLENISSNIAFFMEMQLIDSKTGEVILPVIWDDNYISLLPKEKRSVSLKVKAKYLEGKEVDLRLKVYNLKTK